MKKNLKIIVPIVLVAIIIISLGVSLTHKKSEPKPAPVYTHRTFVQEKNGIKIEITLHAKDNEIYKQNSTNVVDLKRFNDATKKSLKDQIQKASDKYQGIDGLKEKIEIDDKNQLILESSQIDYRKVDKKKLQSLPGMIGDVKSTKKISLKKTVKLLKKAGFKEVKPTKNKKENKKSDQDKKTEDDKKKQSEADKKKAEDDKKAQEEKDKKK
ncbi:DUF1307 domain-containing protein [Lactobacillus sp. YT155]|uniref:DUF1307 domain-containing protein n=1 Tax=Lactobacillus sp. YT155 TaxID=3060955 RepID=UPI00265FB882|nr:DUF1307 domain-containing protein [Lactobacillus sp. YT155]MDO1605013.1 DUF1307 domain-containing protein [Lactobacillus sp. YT155]